MLVYSDGRDVLGATMVAYLLERSGIQDIAVLNGGFKEYQAAIIGNTYLSWLESSDTP